MKLVKHIFKFLILALGLIHPAHMAHAESDWIGYGSVSETFQLTVPDNYKAIRQEFKMAKGHHLYSESLDATVDYRPYQTVVNHYSMAMDQTIGIGMTEKERSTLIERDLERILTNYRSQYSAVLKKRELLSIGNNIIGELAVSFDKDDSIRTIRTKIIMTPYQRIKLLLDTPERSAYSMLSNDFIEGVRFVSKAETDSVTLENSWETHTSLSNIFTVLLPPIIAPYVRQIPDKKANDRTDTISIRINDPIREHPLFYNTRAYIFDQPVGPNMAKTIMTKAHMARYLNNPDKVPFRTYNINDGEIMGIETSFFVGTPPNHPTANAIYLQAQYKGNFLVIQEINTSRELINGTLSKALQSMLYFHPENYSPYQEIDEDKLIFADDPEYIKMMEDKKAAEEREKAENALPEGIEDKSKPPA